MNTTNKKKSATDVVEGWRTIEEQIDRLNEIVQSDYSVPFRKQEYADVYTLVYDLSTKRATTQNQRGRGSQQPQQQRVQKTNQEYLYEGYTGWIRNYLDKHVVPALLNQRGGDALLRELCQRWENHKIVVKWLQKLFAYLDRYYTQHEDMNDLKKVGMTTFNDKIFNSIRTEIRKAVLGKIEAERKGDLIDRQQLRSAVEVFIEMGMGEFTVYREEFERPFLDQTAIFYKAESEKWLEKDSCTEYMVKAESRLNEEQQRLQHYLHNSTENSLLTTVQVELLKNHISKLLDMENSGFVSLVKNEQEDDLSRMYFLFSKLKKEGIEEMTNRFCEHLYTEGVAMVKAEEAEEKFDGNRLMEGVMEIHAKYTGMIERAFRNDDSFISAMRKAFEKFVNQEIQTKKGKINFAEILSNYCDFLMKSGDESLDEKLERVVSIFLYLYDKDYFQEYYRKQLGKRLLGSSLNEEDERKFIGLLKLRQGAAFTSKLETMLTDRNLSSDQAQKFQGFIKENGISIGFDFSVQVLTTGCWPTPQTDNMNPPEQLVKAMENFRKFYDSRTSSRVLQWIHSLGQAVLIGNFAKRKIELSMNTYQASVCLLFNHRDSITLQFIIETLNLPADEVKRCLIALSAGKYKILKKISDGSEKEIKETDSFEFNIGFTNPKRKIAIPVVKGGEKSVAPVVQEDRKFQIEACIVRVMKARKHMAHNDLVAEVSQQLMSHFRPDPTLIKKRIEELIEREYLERVPDKPNQYNYLA